MSIGLRGFVEYLENKIRSEGIKGCMFDDSEREDDVIDMIWDAYEEYTE